MVVRGRRLEGDGSSGLDRWSHFFPGRTLSRASKDVEIEKVHHAENEHHYPKLAAARFKDALGVGDLEIEFHVEGYEADVNEVKTDNQQMIDTVGELLVAVKAVDEKDSPALVQRPRDPDGQRNGDSEIDSVSDDCLRDGVVHGVLSFRCVFCYFCCFLFFSKK